jgi:hypothetical protein
VRRLTKCMEFEKRFSGRTAPRGRGAAPKLSRGVIAGATDTRHGPGSYLRTLENRIRERAHEIWTTHGCIDGQADQHWLAAEHEILTESTAGLPGRATEAPISGTFEEL